MAPRAGSSAPSSPSCSTARSRAARGPTGAGCPRACCCSPGCTTSPATSTKADALRAQPALGAAQRRPGARRAAGRRRATPSRRRAVATTGAARPPARARRRGRARRLGLRRSGRSPRAIDPRAMTDLGLVSVLPAGFFARPGAADRELRVARLPPARRRSGLLGAHLVALVALLHATPAIVYGTLRYSWAWKHVGIVDYIERHGGVTPDIDTLPVYHNWPGFFGARRAARRRRGRRRRGRAGDRGRPLFFNLLILGALVFVFSGADARPAGRLARRLAVLRRQLGRPGLLLAAGVRVLPLPACCWASSCAGSAATRAGHRRVGRSPSSLLLLVGDRRRATR